jgi:hypothetical protein
MSRFRHRRLSAALSLVCVAALALADTRYAIANAAALAVQPTEPSPPESYDPYSDTVRSRATRPLPPAAEPTAPPSDASRPGPDRGRYNCDARGDAVDTIANCNEVRDKHDGGGGFWKIALAIAVAIVIAAIVRKTVFSNDSQSLSETTLLEEGPQLPVIYPDGSLAVRGFARDGWPIVVDFEPQPGTVTQLEVKIGKRKQTFVLDPDGSHGRQLVKVVMPNTGKARTPRPATYSIMSLPIASFDVMSPSGRSAEAAPLRIYGVGGGPNAVGSVAIENVFFRRSAQSPLGAQFSYVAKSEFQRARAQVQVLQVNPSDKTIHLRPVFNLSQSNLLVGTQAGSWPGTDSASATPSRGPHRLQVTAWFTTDDRSWVAALAPDLITQ